MAFAPVVKKTGDIIQSADWNAAMAEIVRLETDKLNKVVGEISGNLSIAGSSTSPVAEPGLTIKHNGTNAWGNALSIDQTEPGNANGLKIRFQRKGSDPVSWSVGILNGANAKQFSILEDTSGGLGSARLVIAPGGNVGLGVNDPKAKLHLSGGNGELTNSEGDLVIGTAAQRLKIGVTTAGSSAGDVRIRAHGGTNRLFIGAGTADTLTVATSGLTIDGIMAIKGTPQEVNIFSGEETQFFRGKIGSETVSGNLLNVSLARIRLPSLNQKPIYLLRVGHLEETLLSTGISSPRRFNSVMTIDQNGEVKCDGTFKPGGADYAELFESENGKQIEVGVAVVINKNGKIRPAVQGEIPVGVISASPAILGNSPMYWPGKFERDEYGITKTEMSVEYVPKSEDAAREIENLTKNGKKLSDKNRDKWMDKVEHRVFMVNPEYDPSQTYTPREERPEWQKVGLLGQIRITKGQPTAPSWVKIKDISDNVELWLVK
jgi:hypothetical protein